MKMILDLIMIILLPLLMIQALVGENFHECIGILMILTFLLHHAMNFNWHKNLIKGNYNAVRIVGTIVNIGISVCMILIAISGVILSQYIFVFLDINQGIPFARVAHMICTHWMFVLTSFHLGMHVKIMKGYIEQSSKRKFGILHMRILSIIFIIIAVYGLKVFFDTGLWQYMFYRVQFMFYDFNRTAFSVYMDYVAMMILFAVIGYFVSDKLRKYRLIK